METNEPTFVGIYRLQGNVLTYIDSFAFANFETQGDVNGVAGIVEK